MQKDAHTQPDRVVRLGEPLRSGWAWGQQYLNGAVAAVESDVGKGKVYLFGPEITFRGQPHGTFKFLFNAIYLAGAIGDASVNSPVALPYVNSAQAGRPAPLGNL